jgi:hypothetical protein
LAEVRGRWRTSAKAVMNLRLSWNAGKFLSSWALGYCVPWTTGGRSILHLPRVIITPSLPHKILTVCRRLLTSAIPISFSWPALWAVSDGETLPYLLPDMLPTST